MEEPSTEGLLSPEQLDELGRVSNGIHKIKEAIDRLNTLALETGLTLRPIPTFPLGQMANDISQLLFSHGLAEKRITAAAFAAVEGVVKPNTQRQAARDAQDALEQVAA